MLRMLYPQLKERSANHFQTAVGPQNLIFHIIQAIKEGEPTVSIVKDQVFEILENQSQRSFLVVSFSPS